MSIISRPPTPNAKARAGARKTTWRRTKARFTASRLLDVAATSVSTGVCVDRRRQCPDQTEHQPGQHAEGEGKDGRVGGGQR
jgi:hypothetical protein